MCRNYDVGECEEPGCIGRITCHDFNDNRCVEHSYNGHASFLEDEDDWDKPTGGRWPGDDGWDQDPA